MNIFEKASRNKVRFTTEKGLLTTEQLWDLSLTALDKIARAVNSELKAVTEESFINITPDRRKGEFELQLDILKFVIAVKMEAKEKAEIAAEKAAKRKRLIEALNEKENEELGKMSKEDILKELESL